MGLFQIGAPDGAKIRLPLARVFTVATFLLDGSRSGRDAPLTDGVTIEVLPPFAGGSR